MNALKERLTGAIIGLIFGCLIWVVLALLFYLLFELLEPSRARFRVPVIVILAPIVGIVGGFLGGQSVVLAVKGWMSGKDPDYDRDKRFVTQYENSFNPIIWKMVLTSVADVHKHKTAHYGPTYFSTLFTPPAKKKIRKEFRLEMMLLFNQKVGGGPSSVATAACALMWGLAAKAADDPAYEELAKRLWSAAMIAEAETNDFNVDEIYPSHLK